MNKPTKINPVLMRRLSPAVKRSHRRRLWSILAVIWVLAAVIALGIFLVNRSAASPLDPYVAGAGKWLFIGTLLASAVAFVVAKLTEASVESIARTVESRFPDLDAKLLTAVEQQPSKNNEWGFLQQDVITQALRHGYQSRWEDIVPIWQIVAVVAAAIVGMFGLSSGALALALQTPPADDGTVHLHSDVEVNEPAGFKIAVQPGDTEIERGSRLLVMAEFGGSVPSEAVLSYTLPDGSNKTIPMSKSLDDPVFAARISRVNEPIKYRVVYNEDTSKDFDVSVFEFPRLERSDAELTFPEYTKRENKKLQDTRRVTAVVGTKAALTLTVNKSLTGAELVPVEPGQPTITLKVAGGDSNQWTTDVVIDESRKYRLKLNDDQGRENKSRPLFALNALANQAPKLELLEPSKDVQVSAIEEVNLEASAWDDFGLSRIGLSFSVGGEEPTEIVLNDQADQGDAKDAAAKANAKEKNKAKLKHLLELEQLEAEPDQLIAYHFWAEDFGPDGAVRRTSSDMYFAEVRPFEEIYRQAQGDPQDQQQQQQQQDQQQQQQGAAQQAQELAELQKEIINATWRVIRRENRSEPTASFNDDVNLITESQQTALGQVQALEEELQDDESKQLADELKLAMNSAIATLGEAVTSQSPKPLRQAMRHEQTAYQTLLKMRAREFEVQQQQMSQQQQQQQQQNSQQRQMQQLDMQQQEDRYEQERQAQEEQEQTEEQRENRQVLSRLRELARRQNDLNDRMKELQSALDEAETEEQREEIEKQLKRLEEEQRQILEDTDELQERMQQSENAEEMSEPSQQLEQAREDAQQAADSLAKGEVSKAAAEGTRAERELKDLRDEFQKRTSGQFNEDMRQMRNQARDLEKRQQDLAEKMQEESQAEQETNSLSESNDSADIAKELEKGSEEIRDLREQMKQTIEEAEEYEPLLADKLYDAFRESEQSRPDQALEEAGRAAERGLDEIAANEHRRAVEGIEKLREGIDEAAESVLGDETEALKLARNSVEQLSQQLENELQREDANSAPRESENGQRGEGERQEGEGQDREPREGEPQEGQPGERQPGEGEPRDREEREGQGRGEGEPREGEPRDGEEREGQGRGEGEPREGEEREGQGRGEGEPREGEPQDGQQPGQGGNQPREGEPQEGQRDEGQQPGEGQGQPRDGEPQEGQPGEGQNGQPQEGQPQNGQQPGSQPGQSDQERSGNGQPRGTNRLEDVAREQGARLAGGGGGGNPRNANRDWAPITGDDYRDWSDRLRDVEEMIADPDLRAEAARIRDQARAIRKDLKQSADREGPDRHSPEPNWDVVKTQLAEPLAELEKRIQNEILRRDDGNNRVPLDREPVPVEFQQAVQRYFEEIGAGK